MTFCPEVSVYSSRMIRSYTDLPQSVQWLTGSPNLSTGNFLHLWIYLFVRLSLVLLQEARSSCWTNALAHSA